MRHCTNYLFLLNLYTLLVQVSFDIIKLFMQITAKIWTKFVIMTYVNVVNNLPWGVKCTFNYSFAYTRLLAKSHDPEHKSATEAFVLGCWHLPWLLSPCASSIFCFVFQQLEFLCKWVVNDLKLIPVRTRADTTNIQHWKWGFLCMNWEVCHVIFSLTYKSTLHQINFYDNFVCYSRCLI